MSNLQWDLIRGYHASASSSQNSAGSEVSDVVRNLFDQLLDADFKSVLTSPSAVDILNDPSLLEGLSTQSSESTSSIITGNVNDDIDNGVYQSHDSNDIKTLIIAIALLHSFIQINWTGPSLSFTPLDFLTSLSISLQDLNSSALPFLTLNGEPAYHLVSEPILLVLSLRLLKRLQIESTLESISWWILRAHMVHQSLLDEKVPLSSDKLKAVQNMELPDDQDLRSMRELEIGLYFHSLGQDKLANTAFLKAAKESGLEFELTGALGKRTKYQVEEHSQLVLLAQSRFRPDDSSGISSTSNTMDDKETKDRSKDQVSNNLPQTLPLNDDTLLEETQFTKSTQLCSSSTNSKLSHLDPTSQPPLHPLDQSLLLSLCLSQHNSSPSHGLTSSQMMPFITRVISHPDSWSVHTTALLLRSRLESNRSRTVERSALQLAALIDQMPSTDSTPSERLRWFHHLPLPSKWEMERELARRYLSLGVMRSALDIFTRLELWEDAVLCLQKMECEKEAISIVKDLLQGNKVESDLIQTLGSSRISERGKEKLGTAREARLWCLLGDLALSSEQSTRNPNETKRQAMDMYWKAWEISNKTSSRAMRSLASLKVSLEDYEGSIECFKFALEINPLYSRSWFTLGFCYMKLERWEEARDAFQRGVGVDEDDAEGWNNLAAVYLRLADRSLLSSSSTSSSSSSSSTSTIEEEDSSSKLPTAMEYKLLAFRALRQGLKASPTNWRMWQNYMFLALSVGELVEACRAMMRLVEDFGGKDPIRMVDFDVLDKLVDASQKLNTIPEDDVAQSTKPEVDSSELKENFTYGLEYTLSLLFSQTLLPRITDSSHIYKSHSRFLVYQKKYDQAVESSLRAYKCGVTSNREVEVDIEKWKEGVKDVIEIVETVRVERGEMINWKLTARNIIRTFMARTKVFNDEPEMEQLRQLVQDIKQL
ncbi:hypothetical protein TREMEDRAFT_30027 [Tremella mesenterica DSM 1558]|uniref:uncharacterized protein n=1 Tax=Tremella mesenterica (strain ATCC 24925 / CBS 8224 / DSM 1558 / NBRC 9311 / NRRL Y-6157 / RJB 2259-6 / UBC 559-6) TaxID=578456 RepID=UPI0003F492A2|nr:uncharacterized protein TREMEDRAFT_30027 [Tremella mesenterica DSM 1558]EIW70151.1 hypothetical protein TREMEDRAFT_30027 [Tremella mesenterica DSM 1558]